ncbi:unnamed protein product [Moneuplotes crassus]|uniref:Uncharacterized protein n=1 Tax=Euplotes crassus TaxID=5936 RepID=A0AAD1USK9_EUPCR|nr:unnamed protein product [Moneuplotes crassus]
MVPLFIAHHGWKYLFHLLRSHFFVFPVLLLQYIHSNLELHLTGCTESETLFFTSTGIHSSQFSWYHLYRSENLRNPSNWLQKAHFACKMRSLTALRLVPSPCTKMHLGHLQSSEISFSWRQSSWIVHLQEIHQRSSSSRTASSRQSKQASLPPKLLEEYTNSIFGKVFRIGLKSTALTDCCFSDSSLSASFCFSSSLKFSHCLLSCRSGLSLFRWLISNLTVFFIQDCGLGFMCEGSGFCFKDGGAGSTFLIPNRNFRAFLGLLSLTFS